MEVSLSTPLWKRVRPRTVLGVSVILVVFTYIFDPMIPQPQGQAGQIISTTLTENSKTGFRQIASVRLTSGQVVRAEIMWDRQNKVSPGDAVVVHEHVSLIFHRRMYGAELIAVSPNNSFKPRPLRGLGTAS